MSIGTATRWVWNEMTRHVWRALVGIVGLLVLLAGIVMIVTPGPAILVIPLGLGILATQFPSAARLLHHIRERVMKLAKPMHKSADDEARRATSSDEPSRDP